MRCKKDLPFTEIGLEYIEEFLFLSNGERNMSEISNMMGIDIGQLYQIFRKIKTKELLKIHKTKFRNQSFPLITEKGKKLFEYLKIYSNLKKEIRNTRIKIIENLVLEDMENKK